MKSPLGNFGSMAQRSEIAKANDLPGPGLYEHAIVKNVFINNKV